MPSSCAPIAFGLDRSTDEKSLVLLLQRLADPRLGPILVKRLTDDELRSLADHVLSIVNRHLNHGEYHRFFLDSREINS